MLTTLTPKNQIANQTNNFITPHKKTNVNIENPHKKFPEKLKN